MILSLAIISVLLTAYCVLLEKKYDKDEKLSFEHLIEEATNDLPMDSTKFTVEQGIINSFTPESTITVRKRKSYNITHVAVLVHEIAHLKDYHSIKVLWNKTKKRRFIAIAYILFIVFYSNITNMMNAQGFLPISIIIFCGAWGVVGFYLENLVAIEYYACRTVIGIFEDKLIRRKEMISLVVQVMDNLAAISLLMVFFYIWLGF